MQAFEYANPATLEEAIGMLGARWGETEILAGGTDLLSLMKNYAATPKRLVNIKGLGELRGVRAEGGGVRIGALTTVQELLDDRSIRASYPALVEAAEGVHSLQLRNMGTVGGDLCQRPRCWYFRNGFGLLARDEEGKPLVPRGDNRYHSIFATDAPAHFVSASSLAPPLIALGTKARIAGPKGKREIELEKLFRIPQSPDEREIALEPNEILTDIVIPGAASKLRNRTYEVRQRELLDWPLATASVALEVSGARISSARVVMGHVAPVPWLSAEAAEALRGQPLNRDNAAKAAERAVARAAPLSRNAYKVKLARAAVKRALLAAIEGGA
jgi:xanthine dehydrogenase YagS FAD-binding subunit